MSYLTPSQLHQLGHLFIERGLVGLAREALHAEENADEVQVTCTIDRHGATTVEVEHRLNGMPIGGWGA